MTGPTKVLRIAVIHDRRIVSERLIPPGKSVWVGTATTNDFVLPADTAVGTAFRLFTPEGARTRLHFTPAFGPGSKVALEGQPTKLAALRCEEAGFLLDPAHRGKLELGGATLLFQFVSPPPIAAVPQLGSFDFRPRLLDNDDPVLLASLSLWSALALVLSVWVWNSPTPRYDVSLLDKHMAQAEFTLPPPPQVEDATPELDDAQVVVREEVTKPVPSDNDAVADVGEPPPKDPPRTQEQVQRELIASNRILMELISSTGESKTRIANAWQGGGIADLDEVVRTRLPSVESAMDLRRDIYGPNDNGPAGVGDLAMGFRPPQVVDGIGGGPEIKVEMPGGTVSEELVGDMDLIARTIKRKRGPITYCYEKTMKAEGKLAGRVDVSFYVVSGQVTDVLVDKNSTRSRALASCIVSQVQSWKLPKTVEGEVSWPFVFRAL